MSLATVASQDHGHSQAVVAVWPGGRELRWLCRTCVPIFGQRLGGKQVGRMRHIARVLGCSYLHCRTSRKYKCWGENVVHGCNSRDLLSSSAPAIKLEIKSKLPSGRVRLNVHLNRHLLLLMALPTGGFPVKFLQKWSPLCSLFVKGGCFFLLFFWDCFQRNADACCPPGLPAKKVADVWLSARTYKDQARRGGKHNTSSINIQPRWMFSTQKLRQFETKKSQKPVRKNRGAHRMLHRFHLSRGYRVPACLSVSLSEMQTQATFREIPRTTAPNVPAWRSTWQERGNWNGTDWITVCYPDWLWRYSSAFYSHQSTCLQNNMTPMMGD